MDRVKEGHFEVFLMGVSDRLTSLLPTPQYNAARGWCAARLRRGDALFWLRRY
jgi:hypothetical protein